MSTATDFTVTDAGGHELAVGMSVWLPGYTVHSNHGAREVPPAWGRITQITEPDGDADDEGRPVAINPRVAVAFDDGDDDSFPSYHPMRDDEATYVCEDVAALTLGRLEPGDDIIITRVTRRGVQVIPATLSNVEPVCGGAWYFGYRPRQVATYGSFGYAVLLPADKRRPNGGVQKIAAARDAAATDWFEVVA